jgi:predicted TPR repeat methyltransferase
MDAELEPDNERNRAYYEEELDHNPGNSPFVYSTLNMSFHQRWTQDLDDVLRSCWFKTKGAVLELMAGCGRNMYTLEQHFSRVEMLERNMTMAKAIKGLNRTPDAVYEEDVRDFNWSVKAQSYDCIFCIWGLSYLTGANNQDLLAGIKKALKPDGYIIFFESVLPCDETESKFHETVEQQNLIRSMGYYKELFNQAGLRVVKATRFEALGDGEGNGSEGYASYLLKLH